MLTKASNVNAKGFTLRFLEKFSNSGPTRQEQLSGFGCAF
jgi:hypothetical protein